MGVRLNTALAYVLELDSLPFEEEKLYTDISELKKEEYYKPDPLDDIYFNQKASLEDFVRVYNQDNFPKIKGKLLVIFPGVGREWHRLSDNIDSYLVDEKDVGTIKYLTGGVYPFNENRIVTSTLEELENPFNRLSSDSWELINMNEEVRKYFLEKGLSQDQAVQDQVHMKATSFVTIISKYLNLDENQIKKLQMARLIYYT